MTAPASPLHTILNPRSVAVIGASESAEKFGGRVMNFIVKHGFKGRILPVNPSTPVIGGIPAFKRISDAPGPIDVALIAVPSAQIEAAVEACGEAGVPGCVVLTADFAEVGDEGALRQQHLVQVARRHGMRLIGPNCLGFINPALRLALTSSVALAVEPIPAGGIGLVSQSGSLMASLISHAQDLGTGFTVAASVGNQADLEICDFIEYFLADPATHAICAYVEGIRDGARFADVAERCRTARKPLLVVKAGQSDAGAQITRSHTASLAGSDAAWKAVCEQHAVILLDDPEALIQCADFLIRFGPPHGDGIAALSPSGGTIAITADRIAAAGLRLANFAPATGTALHEIVPITRPVNPLDVGGLARDAGLTSAGECYELIAGDPDTAVVLIVVATTPQLDAKVRLWAELATARGKPTAIVFTPGALVDNARKILRELKCPHTNRMDDALRVVKAAIAYGAALNAKQVAAQTPAEFLAVSTYRPPAEHLTETETKHLLNLAGIAVTSDAIARTPAEAVAAAGTIGYPVVLKLSSRTLTHKSDIGGVQLNLANDDSVMSAWQHIENKITALAPGSTIECVVQPMIKGGIELIVGTRWDAQFGALVLVGAGGIWAETLHDTQCALAPLSTEYALSLVRKLRLWPIMNGARGQALADIDQLVDAIVRVSWLAATLGPRLGELDINPLLVKSTGSGVIALDARATFIPHVNLPKAPS
ncbi:MAG: acetyl-CoA synthetase [Betaproteobacteria bacterium]|nr:acetyl-CoA synthetase [Betaproteobacteria bacterium]